MPKPKREHLLMDDEAALRRAFTKHAYIGSMVIEPNPPSASSGLYISSRVHSSGEFRTSDGGVLQLGVTAPSHRPKRIYVFACEAHEVSPDEEHDMFERLSVKFAELAIAAKKRGTDVKLTESADGAG